MQLTNVLEEKRNPKGGKKKREQKETLNGLRSLFNLIVSPN